MQHRASVDGIDLQGRVGGRGGGSPHHDGRRHPCALQLAYHMDHLVERRGYEPGEAYYVGAHAQSRAHYGLGRNHHAEVDHLVIVACEHYRHNVLAYVVHVALHGGYEHLAGTPHPSGRCSGTASAVDFGLEKGHGTLHGARSLHHLRKEHLALAEELSHPVHPLHERTADDLHRLHPCGKSLGYVLAEMSLNAADKGMGKPLPYRKRPPSGSLGHR